MGGARGQLLGWWFWVCNYIIISPAAAVVVEVGRQRARKVAALAA